MKLNSIHRLRLLVVTSLSFWSWGFTPHKELHAVAISGLPSPLFEFYKSHSAEIISRATDADKRKHLINGEGAKHYIDLDDFQETLSPLSWDEACEKFTEDTLLLRGTLPWTIEMVYNSLVYEMTKCENTGDSAMSINRVIQLSADLGHYIGDAHVPLHTTSNYNGQLSDQRGIHALWETHVYELTRKEWDVKQIEAVYIHDKRNWIFSIIHESNSQVKEVLLQELKVRTQSKSPSTWGYRTRGRTLALIPNEEFCRAYDKALDYMVRDKFQKSSIAVSSAWYSAWVDAGMPNLNYVSQERNRGIRIRWKNALSVLGRDLSSLLQDLRELFAHDQSQS